MKTKTFTKKQINDLSKTEIERLIFVTNDGQGDTYVDPVSDLIEDLDLQDLSNLEVIDILWEDTNVMMSRMLWIENNECFEVNIK